MTDKTRYMWNMDSNDKIPIRHVDNGDGTYFPEEVAITRMHKTGTATFAACGTQSVAVRNTFAAGGGFGMSTAWTSAGLGFYVSASSGGTFLPLYQHGSTGAETLVSLAVTASHAYAIPTELYAWPWFKFWSQTSGTGVKQVAARTLVLVQKG